MSILYRTITIIIQRTLYRSLPGFLSSYPVSFIEGEWLWVDWVISAAADPRKYEQHYHPGAIPTWLVSDRPRFGPQMRVLSGLNSASGHEECRASQVPPRIDACDWPGLVAPPHPVGASTLPSHSINRQHFAQSCSHGA